VSDSRQAEWGSCWTRQHPCGDLSTEVGEDVCIGNCVARVEFQLFHTDEAIPACDYHVVLYTIAYRVHLRASPMHILTRTNERGSLYVFDSWIMKWLATHRLAKRVASITINTKPMGWLQEIHSAVSRAVSCHRHLADSYYVRVLYNLHRVN